MTNEKTRTLLTIPKEMKSQLQEIAVTENRSFNNLVITILKEYLSIKGQK